jgi:hypothetical protein
LEGIGLSNNPEYSIINQCLPYIANRLLTDTQTMGTALNTFVFGPDKNDIADRLLDTKRVSSHVVGCCEGDQLGGNDYFWKRINQGLLHFRVLIVQYRSNNSLLDLAALPNHRLLVRCYPHWM